MGTGTTISYNYYTNDPSQKSHTSIGKISDFIVARVTYVLLDDSDDKLFNELGGWKSIGTIKCLPFVGFNDPKAAPIVAKPLNVNITKYPLINEVVVLKSLITNEAQDNLGNYKPQYYYIDIIPVWNAPESNAVPDKSFFIDNLPDAVTGKYKAIGKTRRMIKAPGDMTIEGRHGNSIRFGSNITSFVSPWTAKTENPILVITNNKSNTTGDAVYENVNKDGSSIYMMAGHNIGFNPASFNFDSYDTKIQESNKQNIVVTDRAPEKIPDTPLAQKDISDTTVKETPPPTEPKPISVLTPAETKTDKAKDQEELPLQEDLDVFEFNVEEPEEASLGSVELEDYSDNSSDAPYVPPSSLNGKKISTIISQNKTVNEKAFKQRLQQICDKYKLKYDDTIKVIAKESAGKFNNAILWYKKLSDGTIKQANIKRDADYKVQAVGLIQFTNVTKSILGVKSLDEIVTAKVGENGVVNISALKQLDYVEQYFENNKDRIYGADIYALYATVFYPYIVSKGKIWKPDDFVLGSQKNNNSAINVGKQNKAINKGNPVTVASFKNYVNTIFK